MPIKNVTTAGTRVQLIASTGVPTDALAARLTIQRRASNTGTIYIGLPGNLNSGAIVSSAVYDCYLDASNPSVTIGMGETNGDPTDLSLVYLDSSVSGEGVAYFAEQT